MCSESRFDEGVWYSELEFYFYNNEGMKFPARFINLIKNGVCTTYFSINLNRALVGYFANERDIRPGDPMSPYLFLLAMEVFTQLFDHIIQNRRFEYHKKCKELNFAHYFCL